jgi:signal transduction histidine kinase
MRHDANELELEIRDNGIGFDRNAVRDGDNPESGSLGLFGMQIRAKRVGGSVEIKSFPGGGTEVRVVFPLPAAPVEPI